MELRLTLGQSWLPEAEPDFLPGTACFSWSDGFLLLRADFTDREVVTTATLHGQKLWEHGDVAELFIQKVGESGYREYQVAPNGITTSLRYPDITGVAAVRSGERRIGEFLTKEVPAAAVSLTADGWSVSLSIPLTATPGEKFRVSCCRYDDGPKGVPVISSTSPHRVRDFHRPQDWREFIPVAG